MKLEAYLTKNKISQTEFAALIGVTQVTVNRYVKGERFPAPEMIERILKASNKKVAVADWYEQAAEQRAAKPERVA